MLEIEVSGCEDEILSLMALEGTSNKFNFLQIKLHFWSVNRPYLEFFHYSLDSYPQHDPPLQLSFFSKYGLAI